MGYTVGIVDPTKIVLDAVTGLTFAGNNYPNLSLYFDRVLAKT